MNCKQGDLAVIAIALEPANVGAIVEVVCPAYVGEQIGAGSDVIFKPTNTGPYWRIRSCGRPLMVRINETNALEPVLEASCADSQLRPIRDSDGEDEMLRIAGLPINLTEDA